MWPRVLEMALACWLAISPFVFDYDEGERLLWRLSFSASAAVFTLSALSTWSPTKRAHLGSLAVAAVLCFVGYFAVDERPGPPAYQNLIVTGLLIAMFAVLPRSVTLPPAAWRRHWQTRHLDDMHR